jgi:hypothetical protein
MEVRAVQKSGESPSLLGGSHSSAPQLGGGDPVLTSRQQQESVVSTQWTRKRWRHTYTHGQIPPTTVGSYEDGQRARYSFRTALTAQHDPRSRSHEQHNTPHLPQRVQNRARTKCPWPVFAIHQSRCQRVHCRSRVLFGHPLEDSLRGITVHEPQCMCDRGVLTSLFT